MDLDFGKIWGKIKELFDKIVKYFKNFKVQPLYKFGAMIVAIVKLIIEVFKLF